MTGLQKREEWVLRGFEVDHALLLLFRLFNKAHDQNSVSQLLLNGKYQTRRSPQRQTHPRVLARTRDLVILVCQLLIFLMKKWLETAKPGYRGESLRALEEVSKERITRVTDQYFTNLWGVGTSQGRGVPSIEYRYRQKVKAACVKFLFVT